MLSGEFAFDIARFQCEYQAQSTNCGGEVYKKLCAAKETVLIIFSPGGGKTIFL